MWGETPSGGGSFQLPPRPSEHFPCTRRLGTPPCHAHAQHGPIFCMCLAHVKANLLAFGGALVLLLLPARWPPVFWWEKCRYD